MAKAIQSKVRLLFSTFLQALQLKHEPKATMCFYLWRTKENSASKGLLLMPYFSNTFCSICLQEMGAVWYYHLLGEDA